MPFEALGLSPRIAKAVTQAGYTEPTPIQNKAIPQVLTGHDVIGVAQTGTGKTAAFVLPILEMLSKVGPSQKGAARALIVVPTRELVVQVEQNIRKYGAHLSLRYAMIYGGVGEQPQIAALRRGVDIIVATPGRLLDLAGSGYVKFDGIQIVVLDEADRMLDMGFLPPIRQIMKRVPTKRQTLLFSATFSAEIEKTAAEFLTSPRVVQAGKRANPAEGVTQFVLKVGKEQKLSLLLRISSSTRSSSRSWCFPGPSTARTKWRGSSRPAAFRRPLFTRIAARIRGWKRCGSSRPAQCESWWPPISRLAESTCRESPTSSTSTFRLSRKTTYIASAGPAARMPSATP